MLVNSYCAVAIDVGVIIFLLVIMRPFQSWLYPFVFYIQAKKLYVCVVYNFYIIITFIVHLQVLPYLTMHFPLTFSKIQPYVRHMDPHINVLV